MPWGLLACQINIDNNSNVRQTWLINQRGDSSWSHLYLGISEAEEQACLYELWTYMNVFKNMMKYPTNIHSRAMILIHKFLKTRSLATYIQDGGGVLPILNLAMSAFFIASKDQDKPFYIVEAA
jgi:hypothetical protein